MPAPRTFTALLLALLCGPLVETASGQNPPTRTLVTVRGTQPGEGLGSAVAAVGDLNADGYPDFAIGAPFHGLGRADSTGRVLIYFGGPRLRETPDVVIEGEASGHRFGGGIAGVGDVNGDGIDDLVVTAPGYPHPSRPIPAGRAYLFFGSVGLDPVADRIVPAPSNSIGGPPLRMGSSVTGIGDADGDGFTDWAISYDTTTVRNGTGGVFLFRGGLTPSVVPEPVLYPLSESNGRTIVCGVGDSNRDGRRDLVVGEPSIGTSGSRALAYVDPLGDVTRRYGVFDPVIGCGTSLAAAGDLDGDGYADYVTGAPAPSNHRARIFFGHPENLSGGRTTTWTNSTPADSFGCAVAVGGFEEKRDPVIVVGAGSDDYPGTNGGAVYLFRYRNGQLPQLLRVIRTVPGDRFGTVLATVGDVDDNGEPEFLVGSPGSDDGAGRAQLISLGAHTLLEPEGPRERTAGAPLEFRWTGRALADLYLSYDGGTTWNQLARGVGGNDENAWSFMLPDTVAPRARACVIASSGQSWHGGDTCRFAFPIVRPRVIRPLAAAGEAMDDLPALEGGAPGGLAFGGDWSGDGLPDLVVGVPFSDPAGFRSGSVWVRSGTAKEAGIVVLHGEAPGERFGSSVALGDLDGDGRPELLAGSPRHSGAAPVAGRVRIFEGPPGERSPRTLEGEEAGENFGAAIAFLGDWNADGIADFAVAAPRSAETEGTGGGRVAIYRGLPVSGAAPTLRIPSPPGAVDFGSALHALDLNGDGFPDLAVSVSNGSNGYSRVLVYYGGPGADALPDLMIPAPQPFEGFGASLDAGDVTGDGVDDLLVGAPDATESDPESGCFGCALSSAACRSSRW